MGYGDRMRTFTGVALRQLATQSPRHLVALVALAACSHVHAQCAGTWLSSPLAQPFNDRVLSLVLWDADGAGPNPPSVVAGGNFTTINSAPALRVARFDPAANGGTGAWVQLGAGLDGEVNVLFVTDDGTLIAGGFFRNSGTVATPYVARFDGTNWQSLGGGMNTVVWSLSQRPPGTPGGANSGAGQLFAGGWFQSASGNSVNRIARFTGTAANGWSGSWVPVGSTSNPGMNDWVWDIKAIPSSVPSVGGDMIAGGAFAAVNGVSISKIARWNGTSWSSLGPGLVGGEVYELLPLSNGDVIASGNIFSTGSTTLNKYARWSQATQSWSAMGLGQAGSSRGLFQLGSALYSVNTTDINFARTHLGQWDPTSGEWQPVLTVNSTLFAALPINATDIVLGGSFTLADGQPFTRLAVWRAGAPNAANVPAITQAPQRRTICPGGTTTLSVTVNVPSGPLTYFWRRNGQIIFNLPGYNTSVLTIPNAAAAVTGTYDVAISGLCGIIISPSAQVVLCQADVDCSGSVDVPDIFGFLDLWFANDPRAEFDAVPGITVPDIFSFLNAWFTGC